MTKQEAFDLTRCNGKQLAKKLGIEPQAIYQWNKNRIPLVREYQIRDLVAGKNPLRDSTVAAQLDADNVQVGAA